MNITCGKTSLSAEANPFNWKAHTTRLHRHVPFRGLLFWTRAPRDYALEGQLPFRVRFC